jgi:hypothetical protein
MMKGDIMKTKKYWMLAAVVGVFALQLWAGIHIGKLQPRQRSLAGISVMGVVVQDLTKDAIEAGLIKEQIRTDVELKLRREGIRIVSEEEQLKVPGSPCINVQINCLRHKTLPILVFDINVTLIQGVFLMRNQEITAIGGTWFRDLLGCVGDSLFVSTVRQGVDDLVDIFLNDYLAANPKKIEKKGISLDELQSLRKK